MLRFVTGIPQAADDLLEAYRSAVTQADQLHDFFESGLVVREVAASATTAADYVHSRFHDDASEKKLRDYGNAIARDDRFGPLIEAARKRAVTKIMGLILSGAFVGGLFAIGKSIINFLSTSQVAGEYSGQQLRNRLIAGAIPGVVLVLFVRMLAPAGKAVSDYFQSISDAFAGPEKAKAIIASTLVPAERRLFVLSGRTPPMHLFVQSLGPAAGLILLIPVAVMVFWIAGFAVGSGLSG